MNDIIKSILFMGYTLTIKQDLSRCRIEVSEGDDSIVQYLPMDSHLDYAIVRCIRFCIDKLFELQREKKNRTPNGAVSDTTEGEQNY